MLALEESETLYLACKGGDRYPIEVSKSRRTLSHPEMILCFII